MTIDSDTDDNNFNMICNLLIPFIVTMMMTLIVMLICRNPKKGNKRSVQIQTDDLLTSHSIIVIEPDNSVNNLVQINDVV